MHAQTFFRGVLDITFAIQISVMLTHAQTFFRGVASYNFVSDNFVVMRRKDAHQEIRFREESDWPLIWNAQFVLSQDSWLPATDYPRASRSFPRIAGSGNEIEGQQVIVSKLNIY